MCEKISSKVKYGQNLGINDKLLSCQSATPNINHKKLQAIQIEFLKHKLSKENCNKFWKKNTEGQLSLKHFGNLSILFG